MKNKNFYFFALTGLIVATASFFASKYPDGLDFVSDKLGFAEKAIVRNSLMTDYAIPFLGSTSISTMMSGIIGVFVLVLFFGMLNKIYFHR
jgi:hypothetical protein